MSYANSYFQRDGAFPGTSGPDSAATDPLELSLLLAERAALWAARPEAKQLPSLLEWLAILGRTDRAHWSDAQLKLMRKGGLFSIQPGVESLSTHILKLMRKHTTGMRNLELIKWSTYYGINNLYNILLRFPGETAEDYRIELGLFKLNKKTELSRWSETLLVSRFRSYVEDPLSAIGTLVEHTEGVAQ